mgnify:CR=1 FL=1
MPPNFVIVLDPGHDVRTAGKRSPDETLLEYRFNQEVVDRVLKLFKESRYKNITVLSTKSMTDQDVPLNQRCKFSNDSKADLFISVHANAFNPVVERTDPKTGTAYRLYSNEWNHACGFEVYYRSPAGLKVAQICHQAYKEEIFQKFKIPDRGIKKTSGFYILNRTAAPAILIEFAFYTNKRECDLMKTDEFKNACVKVLEKTIIGFCRTAHSAP